MALVLGAKEADLNAQRALALRLVHSGAKARVEARLASLLDDARALLGQLQVTTRARDVLEGAIAALGDRER